MQSNSMPAPSNPLSLIASSVSLVFLLAVIVSLYEIISRYVFKTPTLWAHESVIALVALGYLAGGLYILHKEKHIQISLLVDSSAGLSFKYLRLFSTLCCTLFFILAAFASFTAAKNAWFSPAGLLRIEGTGSAWNPPLPAILKSALAITLGLMAVISLRQFWRALKIKVTNQHYQVGPILLIAFNIFLVGLLFIYGKNLGLGWVTLISITLILGLSLAGLPLAFATGFVGLLITLCWYAPSAMTLITSRIYSFTSEYILVAVPMFILMASLLDRSGIAKDLFTALQRLTRNFPGGLAIQTLLAGLFLAAVSGIIGGEIVLLGLIALPQMLKHGYSKHIAIGTVCAGGSLGTMIPPSIVLIVYGLTASVSVSDLFLATIIPGTLLAFMYVIYIYAQCRWNPKHQTPQTTTPSPLNDETAPIALSIGGPVSIMLLVLGSIYLGIASITEAACIGVSATVLLTLLRKELTIEVIKSSLTQTLESCGTIIWVGIGASILVGVYNVIGGNLFIKELLLGLDASPYTLVLCMMLILLILGLFMDWIGIALLTMPIFVPIIKTLELDPIWFGILFAINMQVSYLSPPFGPAVFYLKSVAPKGVSLSDIYRAVWPFIVIQLLLLLLLLSFPQIALWLPDAVNR